MVAMVTMHVHARQQLQKEHAPGTRGNFIEIRELIKILTNKIFAIRSTWRQFFSDRAMKCPIFRSAVGTAGDAVKHHTKGCIAYILLLWEGNSDIASIEQLKTSIHRKMSSFVSS